MSKKCVFSILMLLSTILGSFILVEFANSISVSFHLYGSASQGWGLSSGSITSPGPLLEVTRGDLVRMTLTGVDPLTHNFYVDYNGNASPDVGEPKSSDFSQVTIEYQFSTLVAGTFTYYCQFHQGVMQGTFVVIDGPLIGDVNDDGIVDIFDVIIVAVAFGSVPSDPNWNPAADLNDDLIVDIFDLITVGTNFSVI